MRSPIPGGEAAGAGDRLAMLQAATRARRTARRRVWRWIRGLVFALAAAALVWSVFVEPASLRVVEYPLALPLWSHDLAGLRVALLADLHVGSPHYGLARLEEVVAVTNAARPDLVLLAGDFVIHGIVGGHFVAPEDSARVLGRLEAPLGTWAVLGNHDWWLDGPRVQAALEHAGIPVLEDAAREIVRPDGSRLWLAGIGDFWEGAHDVQAALAAPPPDATIIAFTHNPDVFPELPAHVALTLAGHTHGGQVRLPFFGPPIVPSRYGRRYAEGHVIEDGRQLFVTPGLGTSILPVRFLVPPEISLLVLWPAT